METANQRLIDLGIIGGGPAGSFAALEAARHGMRVVVWERDRFPRDKVCGEFLSPESLPLLRGAIPETLARGSMISQAEFYSRKGRCFSIPFSRPGLGLSRRVLDESLWRAAAAAGADCREGEPVRRAHELADGIAKYRGWQVDSEREERREVRALLAASGRWWKISGLSSPAEFTKTKRAKFWLGAKAHFKGIEQRGSVEMYFFPGGYCGIAPVEDGIVNACCLVHTSLSRAHGGERMTDFAGWLRQIARHPALDARLKGAIQVSETIATAPVEPRRRSAETEGVCRAGDAAGFLDPFTGDGISMALHSGRLAVEELARGIAGKEPNTEVSRRYQRRLSRSVRRSYAIAALLRQLARAPAELQDWIAMMLPLQLGSRLLKETRWQGGSLA